MAIKGLNQYFCSIPYVSLLLSQSEYCGEHDASTLHGVPLHVMQLSLSTSLVLAASRIYMWTEVCICLFALVVTVVKT